MNIRNANVLDAELILMFIQRLAAYERLENHVVATVDDVKKTLFCKDPQTYALIVEENNHPIGFVIYHQSYSTFLCKYCLHIEDLYVEPEYRGQGVGRALIKKICNIADEKDYGRIDWVVLNWNQDAINFYNHLGAEEMSDWKLFRLNRKDIHKLANFNE